MFRKLGQRAQGRPHDGLEYAHAGGGAPLAQVAVGNLHTGQLLHVGRQRADPAQDVKDQTLHQLRAAQLGSLAAKFGTVLAPERHQRDVASRDWKHWTRCQPIQSKYLCKVA